MKCAIVVICVSGLLLATSVSAHADPETVDWALDLITVVGVGQPPPNPVNVAQARAMAIRAALVDAERKLTSLVSGMAVNGEATVGSLIAKDETTRARVEGVLKGARHTGQPNYTPEGSVELTVVVKRSDLAHAVLPEAGFGSSAPPPGPAPGGANGLIVDVRGLSLTPALAPRLIDDRGLEVYGPSFVTRDYAARNGVVGYAKDPDAARRGNRVGASPLLLKAAGAAGTNRTDAVLSAEDAAKVRGTGQLPGFLAQGRVVFVID